MVFWAGLTTDMQNLTCSNVNWTTLTTKQTFISFSSLVKNEKITPLGVLFKLFSDSQNMKRLSSSCPFQLVKGLETISLLYYFMLFWIREIILWKRTYGVSFSSLFKLSKHEKDWVFFIVKLVKKTSNSDKLVHLDRAEFHLR